MLPLITISCYESPVVVKEGYVEAVNAKLYYKSIGEGEPIIIVHGGPGLSHDYLMPHMNSLSDNFQLIFYDQRGSGLSKSTVDSESISVNQFVEDIEAIRNHLGFEKINILGHSWGGYLAMKYAVQHSPYVKSLILVSSNGITEESLADYERIRLERMTSDDSDILSKIVVTEEFKIGEVKIISKFVSLFFKPALHETTYIDSINFGINNYTAKNMFKIFGFISNDRKGYDLTDQLKELDVPTLIIHGNNDPILPKHARILHETIVGSELVIIENCGHFPFVEQPERFTSAVTDFLLSLKSSR